MEENKQLALKIDGSIQAANEEVNALKAQLADTNKILFKITASKVEAATQTENEGEYLAMEYIFFIIM